MGFNTSYDLAFGEKARPGPNLFNKFLNYGTGMAKIVGGVLEGPIGWDGAAETAGKMISDKIDGKL